MNTPRGPGRPGLSRGTPPPGRPGPPGRSGRPFRPSPAKMNPLPLILGATGVLLVVLLFLLMSGNGAKTTPVEEAVPPPKAAPPPKPVDVSGLEREGLKACREGLSKFRSIESKMAADLATMSDPDKATFKSELAAILELFKKGMAYLNEANEKSGRGYEVTDYMQAKRLASDKYKQMGGKSE